MQSNESSCMDNFANRIHVMNMDTLTIEDVIKDLIASNEISDPFFLFHIDRFIFRVARWVHIFPRIIPVYAMKCNENVIVLSVLSAMKVKFICVDQDEIMKLMDFNVNTSNIIVSNLLQISSFPQVFPANMPKENQQFKCLIFSTERELQKIKLFFPTSELLLRVNIHQRSGPNGRISYSMAPITDVYDLLKAAQKLKLNVVGVSFQVDYKCMKAANTYRLAIKYSANIFQIAVWYGFTNMHVLYIGGIYPEDELTDSPLHKIPKAINMALEKYFPPSRNVTIIAESGDYIIGAALTLSTRIISKDEFLDVDGHNVMYSINDGVYGSFSKVLSGNKIELPKPLEKYPSDEVFQSSIWGPVKDGMDNVIKKMDLPSMNVGDWLIFENMGANTIPLTNHYDLQLPRVYAVISQIFWDIFHTIFPEDWISHERILETLRMVQLDSVINLME